MEFYSFVDRYLGRRVASHELARDIENMLYRKHVSCYYHT